MAKEYKKIEKETRRLIEAVSDIVKRKGDKYKFKTKSKKAVKKIKKSCVHHIIRKGKVCPTVDRVGDQWQCRICGAKFPIKPMEYGPDGSNPYAIQAMDMLGLVNQMQFYAVKLGGDSEDTKMFLKLKELLPRFAKVSKQILKMVNKRDQYEKDKKKSDTMSQFDFYSGYNYRM